MRDDEGCRIKRNRRREQNRRRRGKWGKDKEIGERRGGEGKGVSKKRGGRKE